MLLPPVRSLDSLDQPGGRLGHPELHYRHVLHLREGGERHQWTLVALGAVPGGVAALVRTAPVDGGLRALGRAGALGRQLLTVVPPTEVGGESDRHDLLACRRAVSRADLTPLASLATNHRRTSGEVDGVTVEHPRHHRSGADGRRPRRGGCRRRNRRPRRRRSDGSRRGTHWGSRGHHRSGDPGGRGHGPCDRGRAERRLLSVGPTQGVHQHPERTDRDGSHQEARDDCPVDLATRDVHRAFLP